MQVRRGEAEILHDMLSQMQNPTILTHILYKNNMSYGQLKKYLDRLRECKFIEKNTNTFHITQKGREFNSMLCSYARHSNDEHVFREGNTNA